MADSEIDSDAANIMARLAERVLAARKIRGFPRRVLSERSGISPRYLAQLEAGEGNISLVLLHRVAAALEVPVELLLSDSDPPDSDAQRILDLFRKAPKSTQEDVRRLLAPVNPQLMRAGRICLIGLRGAGKSTLGRMAAKALALPFVELTDEVEGETGMPMAEILALYGADGYRRLEAEALARVIARHDRMILTVAGGIVSDAAIYDQLLSRCHTIWIKTAPAEHMQRVREQGDLRPMQGNPAAMEQLKSLLESRSTEYARASAQVDTSDKTISTSLNTLLATIASNGFLDSVIR